VPKCILSYLIIRANEVLHFFDGGSRVTSKITWP
jgi:hypothetical protein